MKKNIFSYILAGIFVFFIVYFSTSMIIDHFNDKNSTGEGNSESPIINENSSSIEEKEITYKIVFNANNETGETKKQEFLYSEEKALLANEFKREGYTFTGWSTTTTGRVEYTDSQIVKELTENAITINFYAVWQANTYTIEFNANTGTGTMDDLTMTYDVAKNLTSNGFEKEGYTFTGWNTEADGTGDSYLNRESVTNLLTSGSITLYAQWAEHTYKVVFNANNGTEDSNEQVFGFEESKTLTPNGYSKVGYTFAGWSSTSTGRKEFDDGQTVSKLTDEDKGVINLYAVWEANTYVVEFNANATEFAGSMDDQTFTYDEIESLTVNSFIRTGYTFTGWNTEVDGTGTSYSDKESINNLLTSGSMTLYAQWAEHTYTVVFNANDGTEDSNNQEFLYSEEKALLANEFEREGYTFTGWSTTSTGSVIYNDGTEVKNLTDKDDAVINLYAVWEANTYTVIFDVNGGDGTSTSQTFTYDKTESLKDTGYARTGYTLTGWNTQADGNGTAYAINASFNNVLTSGSMTLYAQWAEHTYTVVFNANDGTEVSNNQEFKYDIEESLDANKYEREGYTFAGWSTTSTGSVVYNDKKEVKNLTDKDGAVINLYAIWTANTYTVIFDVNGGDGTSTSQTFTYDKTESLKDTDYARTGYTLTGWNTQADGSGTAYAINASFNNVLTSGSMTLYAQWAINSYQFSVNLNNGQTTEPKTYEYGQTIEPIANPSKAGTVFEGWYYADSGEEFSFDNATMPAHNVSIIASYSNEVYIFFILNYAGAATYDPQYGVEGEKFNEPEQQPSREGYEFNGWYEDEACETPYTFDVFPAENDYIYVGWTAHTYTIEFNANGAEGSMGSQERTYDDNKALPSNGFTKYGYTFAGWNTEADVTGSSYSNNSSDNITSENGVTITLYAQWREHTYTLVLNANDGSETPATTNATPTFEQDIILSNPFTRTGYHLIGWAESTSGEVKYTENKVVEHLTSVDNGTVTLYAVWEANKYTVIFDVNGGDGTSTNQTFTYDKTESLKDTDYARTGYTLTGWNTEADGSGTAYAKNAFFNNVLTSGSMTLYAQWKEHTYTVEFFNGETYITNQTFNYTETKALTANSVNKNGHTFAGWTTTLGGTTVEYVDKKEVGQLSTEDGVVINLYAVWMPNDYIVIFDGNDADGFMQNQPFKYDQENTLSKNTYTKLGYTFIGWSTEADGDVEYSDQQLVKELVSDPDDSIILYAIWKENSYKVVFYANNGTNASNEQSFTYMQEQSLTAKPESYSKTGYRFVGWSTSNNGIKEYDDQQLVKSLTDVDKYEFKLYAVWVPIDYSVVFDGNGADGTMTNQEFTYDEEKALLENQFVKEGYHLIGWATSNNGEVVYNDQHVVKQLSVVDGDTITLYAVWEEITYTLEIHANNGSISSERFILTYSQEFTLSNTFTRVGFTFVGYSTSEDGEIEFENLDTISSLTVEHNSTVHLYVVWEEINRKDVALILNDKEVGTLKKEGSVYTYKHALLDANTSITIINYITDKMYEFDCDVTEKAYYNVTVNLNTITITFDRTYDYIDVGEYDEVEDSVEGIDEKDLSELKSVFDSITTSYTIETQTFFNPAAMDIINDIYDTNYQQHNIINATASNDTDATFTLFDVNSTYVDTYGATTVKHSSSYSVDYEGWTRVAENKYKCDRTEVVEHFRELLTPGLSNQGTYMTYKYVTVEINQDGSLTIRLYCSTTQSGKVIIEHKDKDNKPQWYMLLSEAIITNIK